MTEPTPTCPHLGLATANSTAFPDPRGEHRCHTAQPPLNPGLTHQATFCLSPDHVHCPYYHAALPSHAPGRRSNRTPSRFQRNLPFLLLGFLAVVVVGIYVGDLLRLRTVPIVTNSTPVALVSTPTPEPRPQPSPARATPGASAVEPSATALAGGHTIALTPGAGDAGWWSSGENGGGHLGDSFLYAGYFSGQAFISAIRYDVSAIPRGTAIRGGALRLTGLNADRINPSAGGTWSVQLLPATAVRDYTRADFQALLNAPAAVTLFPTLFPADIGAGRVNLVTLDVAARTWIADQVASGAPAIIARISGPGSGDTLFAWDSGAGPASAGEAAELILEMDQAPVTPPPLPTEAVIVATSTATPANILTVAAQAWTATAIVATTGTPTPPTHRYVTPTPVPANLATVQALALQRGLPPVVPHSPTPANVATATADALYAAAYAFLTGTPAPPAANAVTPVYITATPTPENVVTAAARILAATAIAGAATRTPWPYNAVIVTPQVYVVITATPDAANAATATYRAAYATAVALVIGTTTPFPPNWVTATPAPTPTPPPAPGPDVYDCPDPRAQLTAPLAGSLLTGEVALTGSAFSDAFLGFVIEYASGALPVNGYVEAYRTQNPVQDGPLGIFISAGLPNGVYTLRLTTLDAAATLTCRAVFEIRNP